MNRLFNKIRRNRLAANTALMLCGQSVRLAVQALYFIIIARSLGPRGYGAFIGVLAFVGIFAPYCGLGSGNLLVRDVSRDPGNFAVCWGRALMVSLLGGGILLALVLGLARLFLPPSIPLLLMFTVGAAELCFTRLSELSAQCFQAFQIMGRTAFLWLLPNLLRLAAVLGFIWRSSSPAPLEWSLWYLGAAALGAACSCVLVCRELGLPSFAVAHLKTGKREGLWFSVSLSSQRIYNDIDKTMLSRLATLEATGIYSAAYRIIDVAFTPVASLFHAAYARFFQYGGSGIRQTAGFARRLFPVTAGYSIAVGILLLASASLVQHVLGRGYGDASEVICWLAPLPFLKSLHYLAADTLTGSGFQGLRSGIQVVVAVFNVGLNLMLIPAYSWRGAVWSSLASDGLLAFSLAATAIYLSTREAATAVAEAGVGA